MTEFAQESETGEVRLSLLTRLKYMVIRGFLLGIVKMAGLEGLYRFGWWFGFCECWLQYKRRHRIYRRMDEIFEVPISRAEKQAIARDFFCRVRCDKMMYTIMDRIDRRTLLARVESEDREYLDQAVQRGRGTFLMFSHLGSHHLGGILLILCGYPVTGLRDPNESSLRTYVQGQFEKSFPEFRDLEILPSDAFARQYFQAFQANRIVAAAMDVWRDRGNVRTVPVQVFGQQRQYLSGMTQIALRCKAVIIVGFLLSLPDYRYRMILHPWLTDPDQADDRPETVQRVMQDYAALIERHARAYPSHISKTK